MGGAPSKEVAESDDDCKCFFLSSKPKSDVLGTPMPPTPVSSRKRREDPVMSSVYGGLEKDVGRFSTRSFLVNGNGNGSALPAAQVHEGSVRSTCGNSVVGCCINSSETCYMSLSHIVLILNATPHTQSKSNRKQR